MKSTLTLLTAVLLAPFAGLTAAEKSPPNIVLIFADDLGYGDVGCYGATKVKTPNIDRLASEGRRFTDAHAASAVCTPSRYALLTGEYPFRKNIWGPVMNPSPLVIEPSKTTVASLLKRQGYATACFGKWHLGLGSQPKPDWNADLKPGPLELGFDHYFGIPVVSSHPPFVWVEDHRVVGLDAADPLVYGGKEITQKFSEKMLAPAMSGAKAAHALYRDEEVGTTLTEKATTWMRGHTDKPFFLYFSTPHIHHPFTPGARFKRSSHAGVYGDFIQEFDWMVGEVLRTLDELKLRDNTLVILTSDNGGMLNIGGQEAWKLGHRLNGDLLGFKFDAWEGGHRVPFIARWPGKIEAGSTSAQLICHVDLLSTFAALTEAKLTAADGPDSFNVLPALVGNPAQPVRDQLVLAPNKEKNLALREGRWLYIGAQGGGGFNGKKPGDHDLGGPAALKFAGEENSDMADGRIKADAPDAQLYDLETDLSESTNVIREHPDVAARMKARLSDCQSKPRTAPALRAHALAAATEGAAYPVDFTYSVAMGHEPGVTRRDPSDVIRVGDLYYVWYSKVTKGTGVTDYPSGYAADVWCATSPDGHQWTERSEAIGKGGAGAWDERGVFTPNILRFGGKYFLYFTGVAANHNAITPTKIGGAVADAPEGPWNKFAGNPVMSPSDEATRFDSMRVDDAAFAIRDGKIWFYYKGRTKGKGPGETKMGVAFADSPIGPFMKQGEPLHAGHEVMIWPQGKAVASLATAAGPRMVYYAADGLHFEPGNAVNNPPAAPGAFRRDDFENNAEGKGLEWGISHTNKGGDLYLLRFDCVR